MKKTYIQNMLDGFYSEDDLGRNGAYFRNLPDGVVDCHLKIKSKLILSGLSYFFESFNYLLNEKLNYEEFLKKEGEEFTEGDTSIRFNLPFNVALTGERIALNLLQKSCAISTHTKKFVKKLKGSGIQILDTRKTTPGYRSLEKEAVHMGGGYNHRFGQNDIWMIKDNHKTFFGGVEGAISYFTSLQSFYTPIILEVHNMNEIEIGKKHGIKHFMLDNFSPSDIKDAMSFKSNELTYEVSGGITLSNIDDYIIEGVDAISTSEITSPPIKCDISFKYEKTHD
jgi:nicotinate-nucleotide pyrophosphorylase (carboxylating)